MSNFTILGYLTKNGRTQLHAQPPDYRDRVNPGQLALVVNEMQRVFPRPRLVAVRPGRGCGGKSQWHQAFTELRGRVPERQKKIFQISHAKTPRQPPTKLWHCQRCGFTSPWWCTADTFAYCTTCEPIVKRERLGPLPAPHRDDPSLPTQPKKTSRSE